MTKEQFVTQLTQHLYPYFPEEEYTIRTDVFTKNNNTKHHGIVIQRKEEAIAPTVYVDNFYEDHLHKKITIKEIAERIRQVMDGFEAQARRYQNFSVQWPDCRDKIIYRLISKERNEERLTKIPHIPFLNLAIVFYIVYNISEQGLESICITEELRENWGVSTKELFQLAEENTPHMFAPKIETMESALCNFLGCEHVLPEDEDIPMMYIITNEMGINGATVMVYDHLLENFAEEMQSDLYILPSSIHEILVVPDSGGKPLSELSEMVRDINRAHVLEEEILSDCAYYYDRAEKRFIY